MSDPKVFCYSIPLGPGGRDFSFSIPDDFSDRDAKTLIEVLPALLANAATTTLSVEELPASSLYPRVEFFRPPSGDLLPLDDNKNGESQPLSSDKGSNAQFESVDDVDQSIKRVDVAPKAQTHSSAERWSKKYDRCQGPECNTPNAKHEANGLCKTCYNRKRKKENRLARKTAPPTVRTTNGSKFETFPRAVGTVAHSATVREPETVATPNGKSAWPLRNITREAAVYIVQLIAPKLKTSMTLDEIAITVGANVDEVSKVYDTFKTDIDRANSYGGNTAEIFKQRLERRFGKW